MTQSRCLLTAVLTTLAASSAAVADDADTVEPPDVRLALVRPQSNTGVTRNLGNEELVLRGARIGHIEVMVDDVFENTALSAPYRIANGMHIETRSETIVQQLLFRSGDTYNPRLLAENERSLRAQRYLNDAVITPTRYNEADNTIDVKVRVHDVWTLSPGFSFGRTGGENSTRLKFEDTNFLGMGKQLSAARSSDVDRTTWRLAYTDPHLLGSWWRMTTAYSTMSDGGERAFGIERPFYSLDSRWSASFGVSDTTLALSRYSEGTRLGQFDMRERKFNIGGGLSEGVRDGWVTRWLAGFDYDAREFATNDHDTGGPLPIDRTYAYPWFGVELMEDQYVSTRNLDQIGRTEDLHLGRSLSARVGLASTAWGSTTDALTFESEAQFSHDFGDERYLINSASLAGRFEDGGFDNTVLDLSSRYYLRQSARRVFFASVSGSLANQLDEETQLLLGGDNGLRGYPLRYQAGDASALLTIEQRFYTDWQPLQLVNVGAAVFFDAGRTWGRDSNAAAPQGWLKDVGLGLRLGSPRSGLGNVLHIDLAFPLDGGKGIDSMQLLIETRKSF
ncbi:MAG: BamA/TamA family outer membrane protein [Steroidobacter sp.]